MQHCLQVSTPNTPLNHALIHHCTSPMLPTHPYPPLFPSMDVPLCDVNRVTRCITITNGCAPLATRIWIELVVTGGSVEQVSIYPGGSSVNAFSDTRHGYPHIMIADPPAHHPFGPPEQTSIDLLADASSEDLQLLITAFPTDAINDASFLDPAPNNLSCGGYSPTQHAMGFAAPFNPEHHSSELVPLMSSKLVLTSRSKRQCRLLSTTLAFRTLLLSIFLPHLGFPHLRVRPSPVFFRIRTRCSARVSKTSLAWTLSLLVQAHQSP